MDIATVASNMAVNLYGKTDGGVQIIAVGTLGVLHILEGGGGDTVHSIADLAGRTVYCAGQGPTRSISCATCSGRRRWTPPR